MGLAYGRLVRPRSMGPDDADLFLGIVLALQRSAVRRRGSTADSPFRIGICHPFCARVPVQGAADLVVLPAVAGRVRLVFMDLGAFDALLSHDGMHPVCYFIGIGNSNVE